MGNMTLINEDVYHLWLDGDLVSTRSDASEHTMDHCGNFHMLEHLLHAPPKLRHQLIFQIPDSAFDQAFMREVLGKNLSKGTKKDLDDIGTKTGITLKSYWRQSDDFKRLLKGLCSHCLLRQQSL
ncbi:hypothetical protein FD754_018156 [Muntiacus muntjak]|uniref:Uncharacterized protein n=1 Tax=Muntiacus muntjak TaxID=9888 RepID=A0A5N3UXN4_MUNMU|nr:hypothetical protein FD754_018156 [Muntiacus muntjak]